MKLLSLTLLITLSSTVFAQDKTATTNLNPKMSDEDRAKALKWMDEA
ncbi:MAG: hypothetical protein HOP19_22405, partial [Acidobacteria bacterium]|nr:hypothetical protein [Acidobacteriota bacterium]